MHNATMDFRRSQLRFVGGTVLAVCTLTWPWRTPAQMNESSAPEASVIQATGKAERYLVVWHQKRLVPNDQVLSGCGLSASAVKVLDPRIVNETPTGEPIATEAQCRDLLAKARSGPKTPCDRVTFFGNQAARANAEYGKTDSTAWYGFKEPLKAQIIAANAQRNAAKAECTPAAAKNCSAQGIEIAAGDNFASLTVDARTFAGLEDGGKVLPLVKDKVYACFADRFDFVFLVRNDKDTSFSQYNMSAVTAYTPASFGSAGLLKSVTVLPSRSNISRGATLHEIMHTWGNDFLPTWGFEAGPNGISIFDAGSDSKDPRSGHWGILSPGGLLGGFQRDKLKKNADGSYTVQQAFSSHQSPNTQRYSPLELYLMGLAPESEVGTVYVYERPTNLSQAKVQIDFPDGSYRYENYLTFKATEKEYSATDINKLLAKKGAGRVPQYKAGPQTFRLLLVVATQQRMTQAERDEVNNQLNWFTHPGDDASFAGKLTDSRGAPLSTDNMKALNNFWEATQGRGRLEIGNLNDAIR